MNNLSELQKLSLRFREYVEYENPEKTVIDQFNRLYSLAEHNPNNIVGLKHWLKGLGAYFSDL